jgi:hypothetical protein
MLCPAQTTVPTATVAVTGSKLLRSPPGCATTSTPRSTTLPAKTTRPALGASTATPGEAARSTPRWPDNQGRAGLSKARTTRTGEISGARQPPTAGPGDATADCTPSSTESSSTTPSAHRTRPATNDVIGSR